MSTRPASTAIHPYGAYLHYATTPEQWATLQRRFHQPTDTPNPIGLTCSVWDSKTGRTHMLVWVNVALHEGDSAELLNTIVHEGYHAAAGLLERLSQKLDESEAVAYLVDWVASWLVRNTPGLTVTYTPPSQDAA